MLGPEAQARTQRIKRASLLDLVQALENTGIVLRDSCRRQAAAVMCSTDCYPVAV